MLVAYKLLEAYCYMRGASLKPDWSTWLCAILIIPICVAMFWIPDWELTPTLLPFYSSFQIKIPILALCFLILHGVIFWKPRSLKAKLYSLLIANLYIMFALFALFSYESWSHNRLQTRSQHLEKLQQKLRGLVSQNKLRDAEAFASTLIDRFPRAFWPYLERSRLRYNDRLFRDSLSDVNKALRNASTDSNMIKAYRLRTQIFRALQFADLEWKDMRAACDMGDTPSCQQHAFITHQTKYLSPHIERTPASTISNSVRWLWQEKMQASKLANQMKDSSRQERLLEESTKLVFIDNRASALWVRSLVRLSEFYLSRSRLGEASAKLELLLQHWDELAPHDQVDVVSLSFLISDQYWKNQEVMAADRVLSQTLRTLEPRKQLLAIDILKSLVPMYTKQNKKYLIADLYRRQLKVLDSWLGLKLPSNAGKFDFRYWVFKQYGRTLVNMSRATTR